MEAHYGQRRKFGTREPYHKHPQRVARRFNTDSEKSVALLHDVLEDGGPDWTAKRLLDRDITVEVVTSVEALTRRRGENYWAYLQRVRADKIATAVKIVDLADNLRDLEEGSMKDKYRLAYHLLSGREPPH
jgi:(p)ppGpp synthase/HD superfamily hydrolase